MTLLACIALGIVCGAINGILVGYLRLRAFLTTLVTLIVFRSIYDGDFPQFAHDIFERPPSTPPIWDFMADGTVSRAFPSASSCCDLSRRCGTSCSQPHAARLAA